MPTIQLQNVPKEVYDRLKKQAVQSKRSMSQHVIHILEVYLNNGKKDRQKVMEKIQAINAQTTSLPHVTEEQIIAWIREDRNNRY